VGQEESDSSWSMGGFGRAGGGGSGMATELWRGEQREAQERARPKERIIGLGGLSNSSNSTSLKRDKGVSSVEFP